MPVGAVKVIGQVRAALATFLPSRSEHEMINDQLAAILKKIGQRFFTIGSIENIFLMANIASPPVEVAPGAVTIKFAIHTGTSSVSAIISPRCGVHFNNITNEISGSGHVVQYPVNAHQQD